MLIDCGVEIRAELVCGRPKLFVEVAEELLGEWIGPGLAGIARWRKPRKLG